MGNFILMRIVVAYFCHRAGLYAGWEIEIRPLALPSLLFKDKATITTFHFLVLFFFYNPH